MIPLRFVDFDEMHVYIDIYTHEEVRLGHFKKIFGKATYGLVCVEELNLEHLEQITEKLKELNKKEPENVDNIRP